VFHCRSLLQVHYELCQLQIVDLQARDSINLNAPEAPLSCETRKMFETISKSQKQDENEMEPNVCGHRNNKSIIIKGNIFPCELRQISRFAYVIVRTM
jgi:hypothetical protein